MSCISLSLHQVVNIIMAFVIVLYLPLIRSSYKYKSKMPDNQILGCFDVVFCSTYIPQHLLSFVYQKIQMQKRKMEYLKVINYNIFPLFFTNYAFHFSWLGSRQQKNEKKILVRIMQLFNFLSIICQFDSLRQ